MYKMRNSNQRKLLLTFFNAYVASVVIHGILNYGSARKNRESPKETITKYHTVYELFITEVVGELFKQIKSDSSYFTKILPRK